MWYRILVDWIDYQIIRRSGLFDPVFYLLNSPDVRRADVDPLMHFIQHGWEEGRNPSSRFDVQFYLANNSDVNNAKINPLTHYIRFGKNEGRLPMAGIRRELIRSVPQKNIPTARKGLQRLLALLDISADSRRLFTMLKETFDGDKYNQILDDLIVLENIYQVKSSDRTIFQLIQTSELPEISRKQPRKKILFITSIFPGRYHGGGNRVLNFMNILSRNNDIYLATSFNQNENSNELHTVESFCKSIHLIPDWYFGGNQDEIKAWLNGNPMDIVHYEWPHALMNYDADYGQYHIFTYMEVVSLRLKIDIDQIAPLSNTWLEKFAELIHFLRIELVDAAKLDARIAVTTKDGAFLKKLFPHQEYAVLNHGLTFDEFCLPDIEPEPSTLVFVGNYLHYPNADAIEYFLTEMWDGICSELPDVHIYLVGPNAPTHLTKFANGKSIIFTGGVPDIRPYIQKATIGIAPLISGAGMRGKVLDYAALHRTFVATPIAMTDLVFKDGRDYFCADSPQLFTQKIVTLLKDKNLRDQMAASVFDTALNHYDNNRLVDFMIRFYDHIEGKPG